MTYENLATGEKLEDCEFLAYLQAKDFTCCNYYAVWISSNDNRTEYGWLQYFNENPPECGNPPVNAIAPTTTGNDYVGQVLSGTDGTWTGTAPITYEYKWQRDGVDIPSATAPTFTLTSADADKEIRRGVRGTNVDGTSDWVYGNAIYIYTAEYKAVLNECTAIGGTAPSTQGTKYENKISVGMVAGGAYGGAAALYWFCSAANDGADDLYRSINWMNPTGAKFILNGSPLSISNLGFDLDGIDDAITLPINLSAVGYSITNCSIGVYCPPRFLNNVSGIGSIHLWGANDVTRQTIFYNAGGTTADWGAIMSNATSRDTNNIKKAEKNYSAEYNGTNVIVRIGSDTHTFAQGAGQTAPSYPLSFGRRNKATPDGYVKGVLSYMYVGNASAPVMINAVLDAVTPLIFPAEPAFTLQDDFNFNDNTKMWQDVAKTLPVANTNPVRVIQSQVSARELVATSDANRGTFGTAVINGLGSLNFAGDGDNYTLPNSISNTDHLFIWVFKNLDNTYGSHLMYGDRYVSNTGTGYVGNPAQGGAYFIAHINTGSVSGALRFKDFAGGFNIIAMKARLVSGSTYEWTFVNGLIQSGKTSLTESFTWNEMGKNYLANFEMHGQLARFIHYSGIGSDKQLQDLILSLATTYNL